MARPLKHRAPPAARPPLRGTTAYDRAIAGNADRGDAPAVVEHPDGWYWQAPDGHQEIGPFATREAAQADRDADGDEAVAPGDTLWQTAREAGLADWLDADVGVALDDEGVYSGER